MASVSRLRRRLPARDLDQALDAARVFSRADHRGGGESTLWDREWGAGAGDLGADLPGAGCTAVDLAGALRRRGAGARAAFWKAAERPQAVPPRSLGDRKSTRLNSSHSSISYAVFCL